MLDYFDVLVIYPTSLLILSLASVIAYRATRRTSALIQAVGFLLVLLGYVFQNYGPTQTSYTQSGDAIIEYTQLFSVGFYLGQVGMVAAALASLAFAWRIRPTRGSP